jgi:hypothetical protein
MLKVAELRLCAARWQIESIHRADNDLVLTYRNARLAQQLANRSQQRLKVIDARTVYARLRPGEEDPSRLYYLLRHLLRLPDETL